MRSTATPSSRRPGSTSPATDLRVARGDPRGVHSPDDKTSCRDQGPRVVAMTDPVDVASVDAAMDDPAFEPTQAEIDEWVARERKRRAEWLNGPTEEERAAYARRVRTRRIAAAFDEGEERIADTDADGPALWTRGAARGRGRGSRSLSMVSPDLRRSRPGGSRLGAGHLPSERPPARVDGRRGLIEPLPREHLPDHRDPA